MSSRNPNRPRLPAQAEKSLQAQVEVLFRAHGWLTYHPYDSRRSEPGYPDVTAVHAERGVVFAELKSARGRVSPAQQRWLRALRAARARVYLWRPDDWDEIVAVASGDDFVCAVAEECF